MMRNRTLLTRVLGDMPREKLNLAATMAAVTALTLCIGLTGAWAASRSVRPATHLAKGVAVATPSPSPIPTPIEPAPPPSLPSTAQVVAPSTNVVWALVDYHALFVSPDQGRNWEMRTLPMPFGGNRPVISFITYREGWLLRPGVPATQCEEAAADLWHTTDGAMTWQQLKVTGIDKGQCKDGIWFVDAKHGFITAHDPNHPPTIYRTSDGGNSWTPSALPDPPDFKSSAGGFELAAVWIKAFGSTLYLEAFDDQADPATSHQYLFTSADGAAWAWKQKVPPREPVMVTEIRLVLLTGPGTPVESTNGGQQWHPYATDLILDSHEFRGSTIVFADPQVGYETGSGLLQRTSDGGAHWVRIQAPGTPPEVSPFPTPRVPMPNTAVLSAPSTAVVWALVANNELFRSTDKGRTWTQRLLPVAAGSTEAVLPTFVDDMTGFVLLPSLSDAPGCGDQKAELWETPDGAATWHVVATAGEGQVWPQGLPFADCKDAMHFADSKHGWLATGSAVSAVRIWRTTDGGVTWQLAALNDPRLIAIGGLPLRASALTSFGSTVLAFVAPYVFRSTDGGASWAYAAEVPSTSMTVGFVTTTRWIELVSPDQSIETTDAGSSWHTSTIDYAQPEPSSPQIVFADANVGYATVRSEVQQTMDGGVHWEMIKTSWP